MLNEIIEVQSLNIAKLFHDVNIFLLTSFLILGLIFWIFRYKKISIKFFIIIFITYSCIFGFLFFNGIKIKKLLDAGFEVVDYIYEYKAKNNIFPRSLSNQDLINESSIITDALNCCIEYKLYDYKIIKVKEGMEYHYEKQPGESFSLIIKPENYFRYFIYNDLEKKFEMRE